MKKLLIMLLSVLLFPSVVAAKDTIRIKWPTFKAVIAQMGLDLFHLESPESYHVYAPWPGGTLNTRITKGTADATDFETNYHANSNKNFGIKVNPFASNGFHYAADGVSGTVTANTIADFWHRIEQDNVYIDGGMMSAKNGVMGDWASMAIVDKDGIAYPEGTVLQYWIKKRFLTPDSYCTLRTPYAGSLPEGMWLRVQYHSTGAQDVNIIINFNLHERI